MRKGYLAIFLALIGIIGCAGMETIPSPKAGLVLLTNSNQGAYAYCRLFEGQWAQDELIIAGNDGQPKWAKPEMMSFRIKPSACSDFTRTKVLNLPPRGEWTLFIIWTKFTGQVLNMDVVHFDTSGNPFRTYCTDMFGQKTYADTIVDLPRVDVNSVSAIRINKELYLADWLKALIGLP